jgi:ribosomal protein L20
MLQGVSDAVERPPSHFFTCEISKGVGDSALDLVWRSRHDKHNLWVRRENAAIRNQDSDIAQFCLLL